MAQPGQTTSTGEALPGYNYVGQDQIWKDHVNSETSAAKNWPENWQFLTTKYEDLVKDEFPNKKREKLPPPTPMRVPQPDCDEPHMAAKPSSGSVPRTTAHMIGWRSTDPRLKLEKYGGYAKSRGSLVGQLNWPPEAID